MPPAHPYDLLIQRTFPVRWADHAPPDDRPEAVGLRELFTRAHEIAGIAIPLPPALSALYRVLVALTARIARLDQADGWSDCRYELLNAGHFDPGRITAYFDEYSDRFRLYDPQRPFLQDPRLTAQCDKPAGVNKLITTRPSGNNHSWHEHTSDLRPEFPDSAEAVLHLLIWRYYGPSGRCSSRTVGTTKAANVTAGPLRSALSYHPEGRTLFETLLAGLPEPEVTVRRQEDLCPWEWQELPDPLAAPDLLKGPCSSLTARSQHALLLVPDVTGDKTQDAFITWAFTAKMQRDDPYLIWQTSKEGNRYPRSADSGRALWRDLDALVLEEAPGTAQARRPKVFRTATDVSREAGDLKVRALGFEQDGQAKDIQFVASSTPPVFGLMEERDVASALAVGRLRVCGEMAGARLGTATRRAWASFTQAKKAANCSWSQEAAARYWPAAEEEFWRRLTERDFQDAARSFRRIAERVYDQVTYNAAGTARGARAREEARVELYGGKPKAAPKKPAARNGTEAENRA